MATRVENLRGKEAMKRPCKGAFVAPAFQQWLPNTLKRTAFSKEACCRVSLKKCFSRTSIVFQRTSHYSRTIIMADSAVRGPPGMGGTSTESTDLHAQSDRRPGSHKGFVEEMRFVAMRLHTRDQAKEGTLEESALPIQEWRPTQQDYLQFLVDSKHVYEFFENFMEQSQDNMFVNFKQTGLERVPALEQDLNWFRQRGFTVPEPAKPGTAYVDYLLSLVQDKPHALLCHWYNFYFAHTAGGRMIGRLMSKLLFDGHVFEFYKWERDVKEILDQVRVKIDETAKDWPREVKDDCLKETGLSFSYSGTILGHLAKRG
jgi:heme oxygenase